MDDSLPSKLSVGITARLAKLVRLIRPGLLLVLVINLAIFFGLTAINQLPVAILAVTCLGVFSAIGLPVYEKKRQFQKTLDAEREVEDGVARRLVDRRNSLVKVFRDHNSDGVMRTLFLDFDPDKSIVRLKGPKGEISLELEPYRAVQLFGTVTPHLCVDLRLKAPDETRIKCLAHQLAARSSLPYDLGTEWLEFKLGKVGEFSTAYPSL